MTVAEIQRIGTPEISRRDARQAYLDYKKAVLTAATPEERKEYDGLWRGYKAIAAGQQVLDLGMTMRAAGVQDDTLFPRLAICRADARMVRCALREDGSATFTDESRRWKTLRKNSAYRVTLPPHTLPQFYTRWDATHGTTRYRPSGTVERVRWGGDSATAIVPLVPPRLHPRAALSEYFILWDAVWTPAPPVDPLLLKHLSGHLYAIVAQWDLTKLEQAVLAGRL